MDIKTVGERIIFSDVQVRIKKYNSIGYILEKLAIFEISSLSFYAGVRPLEEGREPADRLCTFLLCSLAITGKSLKQEVFHLAVQSTSTPGGSDILVYTTLSGTVGMLVTITSNENYDFFLFLSYISYKYPM